MNIYKHITISLISALLSMMFVYGGYTIYADDNAFDGDFRENGLDFDPILSSGIKDLYHAEMNDYFNDKLVKFNTLLLEGDDFFEEKAFNAPNGNAECDEDNVSTYCVAIGAMDIYLEYVQVLDIVQTLLASEGADDLDDLIEATVKRNEEVAPEYDDARESMEATISAYNEYRLAYPLHLKYEKTIENLIKYKLQLKDFRLQVEQFPPEFVNATSEQCS